MTRRGAVNENLPWMAMAISSNTPHMRSVPRAAVIAAELSALAVLAFVLARAVWFGLYGAYSEPFAFAEPDYGVTVRDTRLQPAAGTFETLFSGGAATSADASLETLPETRLSLQLYGVRMGETPETGTAIVEAGASGQRTFAVGQAITDDAELAAVYADRIVIDRGGIREVLYLRDGPARSTAVVTGARAISPQALIADLALQPQIENGRLTGFRVDAANDEPAAVMLGLQRGDIVIEINGRPIPQNADAAQRLLPQIGQSLQLTVRRAGERVTLDVSQ
ncbi:type II secretion system protein N [Hyphobacterium sp.]|uniref:type II secretion system protein N n=1 Tax=Hyphobacterium sp. TaxID=2004662 RepID=UPI003BAC7592